MKKILKFALLITFSIITVNYFTGNIYFSDLQTLLKATIVLTIFELLLKPILKLLLLPINILTLGTFRIIINTLGLYLVLAFVPGFMINNFYLSNYHALGFMSVLLTSTFISITLYIFNFICTKKKK
jgi:putative membrane protein